MMETEAGHPNELDTGTVDTLSELIICGVFFNRRPLEAWRMIFRINLAMRGRIWDSTQRLSFCVD